MALCRWHERDGADEREVRVPLRPTAVKHFVELCSAQADGPRHGLGEWVARMTATRPPALLPRLRGHFKLGGSPQ